VTITVDPAELPEMNAVLSVNFPGPTGPRLQRRARGARVEIEAIAFI
jgi:hypothetical protein